MCGCVCEDRVRNGPASGDKGSKGRNGWGCMLLESVVLALPLSLCRSLMHSLPPSLSLSSLSLSGSVSRALSLSLSLSSSLFLN